MLRLTTSQSKGRVKNRGGGGGEGIMAYTGSLRQKGVGTSLVEVYKRPGNLSFRL